MDTYTKAEIERAARILCGVYGRNPDARVIDWKGVTFAHARAVWECVAAEVRDHIYLESALKQAKEPGNG